jgi:hypothetical protein
VIQSDAAGIDQSSLLLAPVPEPVPDDGGSPDADPPVVESEVAVVVDPSPLPDPSPAGVARDRAAARRSFFAQPEPLKWMAGGAKALRTGAPPHSGHAVGPSAWTPWMTSNRRPQAAQS